MRIQYNRGLTKRSCPEDNPKRCIAASMDNKRHERHKRCEKEFIAR